MVDVEVDDVVSGCVRWLMEFDDVTDLLGVFTDDSKPYLFQYQLQVVMEGTQEAAVVVNHIGGWASPNDYNTLKLPRLSIETYVDPKRDDELNYTELGETRRRSSALLDALDKRLHRPQGGVQMWGSIRTIGCTRLGEALSYDTPDGDGMVRSQVMYGVQVG